MTITVYEVTSAEDVEEYVDGCGKGDLANDLAAAWLGGSDLFLTRAGALNFINRLADEYYEGWYEERHSYDDDEADVGLTVVSDVSANVKDDVGDDLAIEDDDEVVPADAIFSTDEDRIEAALQALPKVRPQLIWSSVQKDGKIYYVEASIEGLGNERWCARWYTYVLSEEDEGSATLVNPGENQVPWLEPLVRGDPT